MEKKYKSESLFKQSYMKKNYEVIDAELFWDIVGTTKIS